MNSNIYDIVIIGGGASGLMAAHSASLRDPNARIAIAEKNDKPAKKIYATGNGRCNLLNIKAKAADFSSASGGSEFIEKVFEICGPAEVLKLAESLGICPVEEDLGRMYPRSGQAASVVKALAEVAKNADILTGFEVKTAEKTDKGFFRIVSTDGKMLKSKKLVIAGGGKAGIQFGTDGRCFKLAEAFGHKVSRPIPALTGMLCSETAALAGVRAKAKASLFAVYEEGKKLLAESEGEVQFNKDSISGICVMDLSGKLRRAGEKGFELELDFFPEMAEKEFSEMLEMRKNKLGSARLEDLVPEKLAVYLAEADKKSPKGTHAKAKTAKFKIDGSKGWPDAQVTSGGVFTDEVDAESMESKICENLYFAGEVLDVDGPCGGYNLTWAFASGWIAGQAAAR